MLDFILVSARGRAIAPDMTRLQPKLANDFSNDLAENIDLQVYETFSGSSYLQVGGAGALIEYAGGTHGDGLRPISVSRIEVRGDLLYLFGICHLSGGRKSFRGDRILAIVDPATGESFRGIEDWRERSTQFTNLSMLGKFREDLLLLSYLARADGKICESELDQMEIFLDRAAIDAGENCPTRAAIETMAFGLAPEWTSASVACTNLRKRPDRALGVWRAIRSVVEADGILDIREQELVSEVRTGLGIPYTFFDH